MLLPPPPHSLWLGSQHLKPPCMAADTSPTVERLLLPAGVLLLPGVSPRPSLLLLYGQDLFPPPLAAALLLLPPTCPADGGRMHEEGPCCCCMPPGPALRAPADIALVGALVRPSWVGLLMLLPLSLPVQL